MIDFLKYKTYKELIDYAKNEDRAKGGKEYYELHHILPRSMGGSDKKENLVLLTVGEHTYAHYLLAMENKEINRRIYIINIQAAWFIINGGSKGNYSKLKEQKIKEWLLDKNAQKILEDLKIKLGAALSESRKGIKVYIPGRICSKSLFSLKRLLFSIFNLSIISSSVTKGFSLKIFKIGADLLSVSATL